MGRMSLCRSDRVPAGQIACLQVDELLGRVKAPQLLVVNACPPCQREIFSTKSPNSGSGEARLVGPPDWESGEVEFVARPTGGQIACLQVDELLGRVKAPQLLVVNACPPCQREIFSTKSPNSGSGEARLGVKRWPSLSSTSYSEVVACSRISSLSQRQQTPRMGMHPGWGANASPGAWPYAAKGGLTDVARGPVEVVLCVAAKKLMGSRDPLTWAPCNGAAITCAKGIGDSLTQI
ncbi:hypothetical protein EJB05_47336, partial [Eragrostis curvula]